MIVPLPTLREYAERYIRPSSVSQLAACPGSALMQAAMVQTFGEPAEDPAATKGTGVHYWAAEAVRAWSLFGQWGSAIQAACNAAEKAGLDSWSVLCVRRCAEYARDLIAKYQIEPANVLVEHALDMGPYGFPGRKGTADLVLVVPFVVVIIVDWKAGFLDQGDAVDHDQLVVYGCAAAGTFKCKRVDVHLYQPRADPPLRASAASYDADSLRSNAEWTRAVTAAARTANPALSPSYNACKHCRAIARCPAAKEWFMYVLEALDVIGEPTDPAAWGEIISAAKIAAKASEVALDQAKAHLTKGGPAAGWKLQPAGSQTKVDTAKAIELAKAGGWLDQLLAFASIKAEAAKVLPGLEEACSSVPKSPSIRTARGAA